MIKVLGRKQRITNDDWLDAVKRIEELVPRKELDELVKKTVASIKKMARSKKAAYGWSGGKDSIVLSDICKKAGIKDCMFAHTNLEYPAFLKWCLDNKPERCEVINTGQDISWLAKHPDMVFPHKEKLARWYSIVQHRALTQYFFQHQLDIILVGRRKADGNFVGKDNILKKKSGECIFAPLADWPHEMILAYIHYHKLALPPLYEWENGYRCGTHPWPSRMYMDTLEQGYREVYAIDPSIVKEAAEHIDSARHFLKEVSGA